MQTVPRLLEQFIPTDYKVYWNLENAYKTNQIEGKVNITGQKLNSETLRLHSKDLLIKRVALDGREIQDFKIDAPKDELIIKSDSVGNVEVEIDFELSLTDSMHGIYPCYFEKDSKRQKLIATQFESHHAREAMPCIDEPSAKAIFQVSIRHLSEHVALGNTKVETSKMEQDFAVTTFRRTPKMSSYLLAFVVGDMQSLSQKTKRGIDVNIWSTSIQPIEYLEFALDASVKIIDFYEEYFGVNYPLEKCDHVALPDFSSGAMENWGLITYREVALLADPKLTSVSSKHFIASVIAHELSHQWFGNLVTMKWWDNLWLNESFADFVEHIAVDSLYPEWNTWQDFILSRGIGALRRDAIDGVQSVQVEVNHPDEISTLFDGAIVYGKGARLIKMLWRYVGDDAFRSGLKSYFEEFAYSNTEGSDLWRHLTDASGKDVAGLMSAWLTQPGFPLVEVKPTKLEQRQFFIGEHSLKTHRIWPIPLAVEPRGEIPEVLSTASLSVNVTSDQVFNSEDNSHYIPHYSLDHLNTLLSKVSNLSVVNRIVLINDQTLLVRAGLESSASLVNILQKYRGETVDTVWSIMSLAFSELKKFVELGSRDEAKLKSFSRYLARDEFKRLGVFESVAEPINDQKMRPTILSMMLYSEDSEARQAVSQRFKIDELTSLPSDMRPIIIGAEVKFNDSPRLLKTLMDLYKTSQVAEFKEDIMLGVTSSRSPVEVKNILDSAMDGGSIRPQDFAPWFIYFIRSRYTRDVTWQWIRDNWQWVKETFGGDKSYNEYPRYAAGGLDTEKELKEYIDFFEPMKDEPALTRTIEMGISEIKSRINLLDSDRSAVLEALDKLDLGQ